MRPAAARRSTPPAARRAAAVVRFGLVLPALLGGLLAAAPVAAQYPVTVNSRNYRVTSLAVPVARPLAKTDYTAGDSVALFADTGASSCPCGQVGEGQLLAA